MPGWSQGSVLAVGDRALLGDLWAACVPSLGAGLSLLCPPYCHLGRLVSDPCWSRQGQGHQQRCRAHDSRCGLTQGKPWQLLAHPPEVHREVLRLKGSALVSGPVGPVVTCMWPCHMLAALTCRGGVGVPSWGRGTAASRGLVATPQALLQQSAQQWLPRNGRSCRSTSGSLCLGPSALTCGGLGAGRGRECVPSWAVMLCSSWPPRLANADGGCLTHLESSRGLWARGCRL